MDNKNKIMAAHFFIVFIWFLYGGLCVSLLGIAGLLLGGCWLLVGFIVVALTKKPDIATSEEDV